MVRNKFSWFAYSIIGLGIVGLTSQLVMNPFQLFKSVLFILVTSALIFGLIYFLFFRNRHSSNEMKKYKEALKQSKEKYQTNKPRLQPKRKSSKSLRRSKGRSRAPHLRVIHGKKSKKRNRANF